MKIRLSQLKRIIKEEVARATRTTKSRRRLSEMGRPPADFFIELPNCNDMAEGMDMSLDELLNHIKTIGSKYPSITFEGPEGGGDGYSSEYDSLHATGSKRDLTKFAMELDEEFMGGAQSIADEDSYVNAIKSL